MAMSNAVFIVGEGVGGGAVPLSRFLCFPRSVDRLSSQRLERKTGKRDQRKEKETEREREEIYVPDAFFRATTLTAYKMFTKHLCVRVSRTRRPRRFLGEQQHVPLDARDDANEERDAAMTNAKFQGSISDF